jgi:Domain of unknown function (DUF4440)
MRYYRIGILLICSLISLGILAQTKDEQEVAKAVETLRQVMIHPDSIILKNLAADELVYVHSSGTARNKRGFIDEFMKGWSVMTSLTISDQSIQMAGNNAIVRHHLTGDTFNKNVAGKLDIIVLMVWQKQKGHWKLLARQAAKIPI